MYKKSRDRNDSSEDKNNEEDESKSSKVKDTHIPWSLRVRLLADVADGMCYLHGVHNSVHRDLKSSNVLLTEENGTLRAKVADFGLARLMEQEKGERKHKKYLEKR